MRNVENLVFAVLALLGLSVPLAAYLGYYAPVCGWSTVWTLGGHNFQYVCL